MIANAGYGFLAKVHETTAAQFDDIVATNIKGTLYAMTKAAQLSLAEAMRVELAKDQIYVSTVHPLTTATEFFEVASKKSRLSSTGLGHAQPASVVAQKIAKLIHHPKPELWPVPFSAWMLSLATLFPRLADHAMAKSIYRRTR
jgi:short-subunit dehydrogenase